MSEYDWFDRTFRVADDVTVLPECWEPFGGYSEARLRDELWPMLQQARPDLPATQSRRRLPADEPEGLTLAAPIDRFGLRAICTAAEQGRNAQLVALLPRTSEGVEHRVLIEHVALSTDRVQLRVHGELLAPGTKGDDAGSSIELVFYDQGGPANRCHYEAGAVVAFVISGIALSARPAESEGISMPTPQWMRAEGETRDNVTLRLDELKMLLPLGDGAPPDIYSYRGRVTRVEPLHMPMLGEQVWQLRVAMVELDGQDVEFGLLVTARIVPDGPPQVGSFIEGVLWLQGSYWRTISEFP